MKATKQNHKNNREQKSKTTKKHRKPLKTEESQIQQIARRSNKASPSDTNSFGACKLLKVKHLLKELGFDTNEPIILHCQKKKQFFIAYIAFNPVYHERTKTYLSQLPLYSRINNKERNTNGTERR